MNENGAWIGNNSNIVQRPNFTTGNIFEQAAEFSAQLP
jgi:hypothetical protein